MLMKQPVSFAHNLNQQIYQVEKVKYKYFPSENNKNFHQVWWYMAVVPALGRPSEENHEFEASLGYTADPIF
jgi:hypothetical protein